MTRCLPVLSCTWANAANANANAVINPVFTGIFLYMSNYLPVFSYSWAGAYRYFPAHEPVLTGIFLYMSRYLLVIFCTWAGTYRYFLMLSAIFLYMSWYLPVFYCSWAGTYRYFPVHEPVLKDWWVGLSSPSQGVCVAPEQIQYKVHTSYCTLENLHIFLQKKKLHCASCIQHKVLPLTENIWLEDWCFWFPCKCYH